MSDRHVHADGLVHAVAVATRRDGRWLLIRRSAHVSAPLAVAFPGGALEAGETQRDAVVREMHEELGVTVRPIACFFSYLFENRPLRLWGWHAELSGANLAPDPAEVHEVLWLTARQATSHPSRTPQMEAFITALERYLPDASD